MAASTSLKEYLKRYESADNAEDEKKSIKKTNKKKKKAAPALPGVIVVDEDPVWQKPVQIAEEDDHDSADETPQVEEDINVRHMKRLDLLRAKRAYHGISEDGSGWIPVTDTENQSTVSAANHDTDFSPPRKQKPRSDTPPASGPDMSPPRKQRSQFDTISREDRDSSPSRRQRARFDTASPRDEDISPPRKKKARHHTLYSRDLNNSPPREHRAQFDAPSHSDKDISPPRKRRVRLDTPSPEPGGSGLDDISPPRKRRGGSPNLNNSTIDFSPPRKSKRDPVQKASRLASDLSPPRKTRVQPKTGLVTGRDITEEITRTKDDELSRFKEMDPNISGRNAEIVYRDKLKGTRISKEEFLNSQKKGKKEEKPKEEKKLEWGKGLAQKREAEAAQLELELEKNKPFARSKDDPELDAMLKDRIRFGDPMAHLVKRKQSASVVRDFGEDENMKESGFIVPQEIPMHSWIKRGLEAAPNRYGIKPGRHWDGVDRSSGYEKELFKRMNEKKATEREAYLWSVADM